MRAFAVLFVVLVLFGCNVAVNNTEELGNRSENQTNKSVENESGSGAFVGAIASVVHNTSDKYYQRALDEIKKVEDLVGSLNLSGYEEQKNSSLTALNKARGEFEELKYRTAYFNAKDAFEILEDIKEELDALEEEKARVEEERRKEEERFAKYNNLLRIEYEIDDAIIYVRTVDTQEKTIELFNFRGQNKFDVIEQMLNRTKFSKEEIEERLKYKVVPRSAGEEEKLLVIDVKDFNGYSGCNSFFGAFSVNDTFDPVAVSDFNSCRSFFNMAEDEFSNSQIDEVGEYAGCEDMYEDYDRRQYFSDINVEDAKACEDFFEELRDRYG